MPNAWRTLDDGRIEVNGEIPELSPKIESLIISKVVEPWGSDIRAAAFERGLLPSWLGSMIWRESHGNARIVGNDPGGTHGYGLFQLTHPSVFKGHAPQETLDNPALNIALGADLVQAIAKRVPNGFYAFPKVSSIFNAGGNTEPHASSVSPWGYRESAGHIDEEVRAVNTLIRLGFDGGGEEKPGGGDTEGAGGDDGVTWAKALAYVAGGGLLAYGGLKLWQVSNGGRFRFAL
jgi:hypothetical protein